MQGTVKITQRDGITLKSDNECLASVGMDVRRGLTKELYIAMSIHAEIIPCVAPQTAL